MLTTPPHPTPPPSPISSWFIFFSFLSPWIFSYNINSLIKSQIGHLFTEFWLGGPMLIIPQRCHLHFFFVRCFPLSHHTLETHLSCYCRNDVPSHIHTQVCSVSSAPYLFISQLYWAGEWSRYWMRINRSLPRMHTVNRLSPQADAKPLDTFAFGDNYCLSESGKLCGLYILPKWQNLKLEA